MQMYWERPINHLNLISDTKAPDSFDYELTPDPETLQYVNVTLYPSSDCANLAEYQYPLPPSQLCAGFIEAGDVEDVGGACHGDR